jgi:probable phosphoglycerate mutase
MTDVTRLILIRHGEAQTHVDQIIGGHQGCTGLSDLGRRQVEALRKRLERTGELADVKALYASVLPRAIETAQIIAPALGLSADDVQQECNFCEVHTGDADGLSWDEWRAKYVPENRDEYTPWAPGGESWVEFAVRAGTALRKAASDHAGQTIVIACHGGVIESALVTFANQPIERHWRATIDNASITEWTLRNYDDWMHGYRWTLERFNDHAHLSDL